MGSGLGIAFVTEWMWCSWAEAHGWCTLAALRAEWEGPHPTAGGPHSPPTWSNTRQLRVAGKGKIIFHLKRVPSMELLGTEWSKATREIKGENKCTLVAWRVPGAHSLGSWEGAFWWGVTTSLLCYIHSPAFTALHGWREDADVDESWIDTDYFHWHSKDLVEMALPFKITLTDNILMSTVQVPQHLFQLTLNPPGSNVQCRSEMSSPFFHTQAGNMFLTDKRRSGFPASSTLTPIVNLSKDRGLIFISADYKQPLLKPKGAVSFQDLPPISKSSTVLILFRWTSCGKCLAKEGLANMGTCFGSPHVGRRGGPQHVAWRFPTRKKENILPCLVSHYPTMPSSLPCLPASLMLLPQRRGWRRSLKIPSFCIYFVTQMPGDGRQLA